MRRLYKIDDNGADYWVIATTPQMALMRIINDSDRDDFAEPPFVVEQCTQESLGAATFRFDGEDDECSMWFAYMIARDYGSGILACSEWL